MKIINGSDVDVKYSGFILLSSDDTNWDILISKKNISKIGIFVNSFCVQILYFNSEISFSLNDITNQVAWTADQAGLNQARSDISNWANDQVWQRYEKTFITQTTVNVVHGFTQVPHTTVKDENGLTILPDSINDSVIGTTTVTFLVSQSGSIICSL